MTKLRDNNLEQIQTYLKDLARRQATYLNQHHDTSDSEKLTLQPTDSDQDPSIVEKLNAEIGKLYETGVVVPRTELVDDGAVLVSPIYDALSFIFKSSDEQFRQKHLDDLVGKYFRFLEEELVEDQREKLTEDFIEYSVRVFLPAVKMAISLELLDDTPKDLRRNINNFIKTPLLNQEDLYVIIRNKLGTNEYHLLSYGMRSLNESNGHLGQYYHLDIEVRHGGEDQKFTLFAKFIIPPTETMGAFVKSGPAKREHFFYNVLMPLFRENGLGDLLDFAPTCYLSRIGWLLVLDDLGQEGYLGLKPNNVLDYDALIHVVSSLAKLHSCSIIYEELVSKRRGIPYSLFDDFGEILTDPTMKYDEANPLKAIFDASRDGIKHIFDLVPDLTTPMDLSKEELSQCIDDVYMTNFTKLKQSDTYRNVISHGDMYMGNLLVKYDSNQTVTDTLLVDFQMLRYTPLPTDVLCILHTVTTKETRDKHLVQLLEQYYDDVRQNTKRFDVDLEEIYTKEEYWNSIEYTKSACLVTAMEYNHIIHVDPEFREKLFHDQQLFDYYIHANRNALIDMNWSNRHYQSLLRGMVEDMIQLIGSKNY
ncbi:uncharacterized protein LOC143202428 [Rhynchophorus ferrugineus]|uniref:uncharacterized protein LOC143202428 n=1 Tax=Rhynchophorus ferrugineus TaxID=354439 RepID=UPI003FCE43FE